MTALMLKPMIKSELSRIIATAIENIFVLTFTTMAALKVKGKQSQISPRENDF